MVLGALLLLAGAARADADHERTWGFGWDTYDWRNGLTLARQLGDWQLAVSGGPMDRKREDERVGFGTEVPDSLQGFVIDTREDKRESGFVRFEMSHCLASHESLRFSAMTGAQFAWSDYQNSSSYYSYFNEGWRHSTTAGFSKTWHALAGARITWFPWRRLSVEKEFGLVYEWYHDESTRTSSDDYSDPPRWERNAETSKEQEFYSFGDASITGNLRIIYWF